MEGEVMAVIVIVVVVMWSLHGGDPLSCMWETNNVDVGLYKYFRSPTPKTSVWIKSSS